MSISTARLVIRYIFWALLVGAIIWAAILLGRLVPVDLRRDALLFGLLLLVGLLNLGAPIDHIRARVRDRLWLTQQGERLEHLVEALAVVQDQAALQTLLVHRLPQIMGLPSIGLYLHTGGKQLTLVESTGMGDNLVPQTLPLGGPLASYLVQRRELVAHAVLVRALAHATLTEGERRWMAHEAGLWVPLTSHNALQGILVVGPRPQRRPFTVEERQLLQVLAHQAGITAQAAQLATEVRARHKELAAVKQKLLDAGEKERRRLARELHDGAVQQLLGISYQLASLSQAAGQQAEVAPQTLQVIRQEVLDVVSQLRAHIGELRPAGLEEVGLVATLTGYVARLQREQPQDGPAIGLSTSPALSGIARHGANLPALSPAVALCLFRVAQEGLRNALKHAGAAQIAIHLTTEGKGLLLTVRDDGCGFEVPARLSELGIHNHFGLVDMSERVAQVGGTLTIRSQPGQGTEIIARVPLLMEENSGDPTDSPDNC